MTLHQDRRLQAAPAHLLAPAFLARPHTALHVTAAPAPDFDDIVDEWGAQSFPASDPPANW